MSQANGNTEQQLSTEQPNEDSAPRGDQQQPQQHHAQSHQQNLTDPLVAATSLDDSGQAKRPRDARLLHIILSSLQVQAYQERVPLQLMDFAYRYTSGVLQDAVHLTSEAYGTSAPGNKNVPQNESSVATLQSLRLAIASRQHYQFQPTLPKEHFTELAAEKNKVALPPVGRNSTIRLPPERYRLTGVGYGLSEEWDEEVETTEPQVSAHAGTTSDMRPNGAVQTDVQMQGVEADGNNGQADEPMQDA